MSSPLPQNNYETLYGVGLLDDLHNFFPALLYDSSSFRSVQDVLGYIQRQSRARFDLFSYGLREYQSTQNRRSSSQLNSQTNSLSLLRTIGSLSHSNLVHPANPIRVEINLDETQDNDADTEGEEEGTTNTQAPAPNNTNAEAAIASILLQMLSSSRELPSLTTRNILMPLLTQRTNTFLEPVIVRPTPQQIEQNTTAGNIASDQDIICSICQDNLQPEQEGRKLNACGHWFHKTCIDTWFQRDVHCPVCRHDVRESTSSSS